MITVFNVGQGDSILLHPDPGCDFYEIPILIDCGSRGRNVHLKIQHQKINLLLTHAHEDHIGDIHNLVSNKKIENLYIPYYLPEIIRINSFLGRYSISGIGTINFNSLPCRKIILLQEDDILCNHLYVLNPPVIGSGIMFNNDGIDLTIDESLTYLESLGIELPRQEILNYISEVSNLELPFSELDNPVNREDYGENARNYVHNFFINLAFSLQNESRDNLSLMIESKMSFSSHKVNIVFRYDDPLGTILFTGDADISVFNRLIKNKISLEAKYLKVPHHGSKYNLSSSVIAKIKPEYAIISHDNGSFAGSTDTHPNNEILTLLSTKGIKMVFTNDVKKGLSTPYFKTVGRVDSVLDFI